MNNEIIMIDVPQEVRVRSKEVYIVDDLYANREPRLYKDCPTLRSERFGLKVLEEFYTID